MPGLPTLLQRLLQRHLLAPPPLHAGPGGVRGDILGGLQEHQHQVRSQNYRCNYKIAKGDIFIIGCHDDELNAPGS